jgi:hypothetical protein
MQVFYCLSSASGSSLFINALAAQGHRHFASHGPSQVATLDSVDAGRDHGVALRLRLDPMRSEDGFHFTQRKDASITLGLLKISHISGHQKRAFVLQGNCVVQRIEKMMAAFDCEFGRSLHQTWFVPNRKLHRRQHSNILKRRLRA